MITLFLDYETYYDSEYSLSKMQTDAYILDPRFEIILCNVTSGDSKHSVTHLIDIHSMASVQAFRDAYDWSNAHVVCHHALFDGFITTRRLGIKPKLWGDTLPMARMHMPWMRSHSLDNVARELGLPAKGTIVKNMMGRRKASMTDTELLSYAAYCRHDTDLCRGIYEQLEPRTPALHMHYIDMLTRMFTEPVFEGDQPLLKKLYADEVARKDTLLAAAAIDKSVIMSNDKMAAQLLTLGVDAPLKVSAKTGKLAYAFAKTDRGFTDLLEHPDPAVQALVAARLGVKTTIAETRALRFVETAVRGPMPVYLNTWGAKTTGRVSGGNSMNWQNLPARGPTAGVRKAIAAPPGHVVCVGDSSNIELRIVMAVAGHTEVLEQLRNGVDLYCDFASYLMGRTITKADVAERQLGKVAMLSLQYGAGPERFMEMVRLAARNDPNLKPIDLAEATRIVHAYRTRYWRVKALWDYCHDTVLPDIANGSNMISVDVNGWCLTRPDGFGRPSEPGVVYKNLRLDGGEYVYDMGNATARIHGPKLVENCCQYLAMLVVSWQTARINTRYPVKLVVHDEAVTVPALADADDCMKWMETCLRLAPPWCRDILPVACEVKKGPTYGHAK